MGNAMDAETITDLSMSINQLKQAFFPQVGFLHEKA